MVLLFCYLLFPTDLLPDGNEVPAARIRGATGLRGNQGTGPAFIICSGLGHINHLNIEENKVPRN